MSGVEFTTLKKRYNVKSAPPFPIKEIGLIDKINLKICSKRNINKLEERIIRENANTEKVTIQTDLEKREKELWEIDAFSEFLARNTLNESKYLRSITGLENGTVFEVRGWGVDFSTILTNLGIFRNEDKLAERMQKQLKYFPRSLTVLFQANTVSKLSKPVFIVKKCRRDDFEILEQVSSDIIDKTTQLYPTQFEINAALNKEYTPSKYMKLETLKENETYFIQTITKIFFRQKIRYLIRTDGNIYISNEFFEDAMSQIAEELEEDHKYLHTLEKDLNKKVVVMKTYSPMYNSQRNQQLFVTLNFKELAEYKQEEKKDEKGKVEEEKKVEELDYSNPFLPKKDEETLRAKVMRNRLALECSDKKDFEISSRSTVVVKSNPKKTLPPFLSSNLRKISTIENNSVLEIRGDYRDFRYVVTPNEVFENDDPDLEKALNALFLCKTNNYSPYMYYNANFVRLSHLVKPLFVIQKKDSKINIVEHINFEALAAIYFFNHTSKRTTSELVIDKKYEIEHAEKVTTSYGNKLEVFLFDDESFFKIYLPLKFQEEIKDKNWLIYKGTTLNNSLDVVFESIKGQNLQESNEQNSHPINKKVENKKDRNRKVKCEICSKEIAYTQLARHRRNMHS